MPSAPTSAHAQPPHARAESTDATRHRPLPVSVDRVHRTFVTDRGTTTVLAAVDLDVAGDEITDEMDNKSTGSFTVSSSGSQTFKPEDGWSYTIYWHLK